MQEEIESLKRRVQTLEKQQNKLGAINLPFAGDDVLLDEAIRLVVQHDKASASLLQRRLSVGYARAARILDQLNEKGIIGKGEGSQPRDVLIKNYEDYKKSTES